MWPFSTIRNLRRENQRLEHACLLNNRHYYENRERITMLEQALNHQRNLMDEAALSSRKLIEISKIESGLIDALGNLVMTCRTHFDLIQNECTPKSRAETRRMRNLARHMIERIDAEMTPKVDEMIKAEEVRDERPATKPAHPALRRPVAVTPMPAPSSAMDLATGMVLGMAIHNAMTPEPATAQPTYEPRSSDPDVAHGGGSLGGFSDSSSSYDSGSSGGFDGGGSY